MSGSLQGCSRAYPSRRSAIACARSDLARIEPSAALKRVHQLTAVNGEHGPRGKRSCVGGEQKHGGIELLRLPEAPLRDALDHRLSRFRLEELAVDAGLDVTRRECVHANPVTRQLERH